MQRILEFAKKNRYLVAIWTGGIVIVLLAIVQRIFSGPITGAGNNFSSSSSSLGTDLQQFGYLSDHRIPITGDDGAGTQTSNIQLLRGSLPVTGPGYTITYTNPKIRVAYESDTGLQGATIYLKQFGVTPDYPDLEFAGQ